MGKRTNFDRNHGQKASSETHTLRGSAVDRTDWKGYILPLLFFKRIVASKGTHF